MAEIYCVSCEKHTEKKNNFFLSTFDDRIMLSVHCVYITVRKIDLLNNKRKKK